MLFKNSEKCFLFYFKSSFRFEYIWNFVLTFLLCRKNDLIRKLKLILNFMTSQTGKQIITIKLLPNVSRNKLNQVMKFSQLTENNMTDQNDTQNVVEKLV